MSSRFSSFLSIGLRVLVCVVFFGVLTVAAQTPAPTTTSGEDATRLVELYNEALKLFEEETKESFTKARDKFRGVYEKIPEGKSPDIRGKAIFYAGWISNSFGELETAVREFRTSVPLLHVAGESDLEATALSNIGLSLSNSGKDKEAVDYYNQSLAISTKANNKTNAATTAMNLGVVLDRLGQLADARKFLDQSIALFHELGNKDQEGELLNFIGVSYLNTGETSKALEKFLGAIDALKSTTEKQLTEGQAQFNTGVAYYKLDEKTKAVPYYERSLVVFRKFGNKELIVKPLADLALLAQEKGDHPTAAKYREEAIQLARDENDLELVAIVTDQIANDYAELDDIKKSLEAISTARELYKQLGNRPQFAATYLSEGNVYERFGNHREAFKAYTIGLPLFRELNLKQSEADCLQMMGRITEATGARAESVKYLQQSLAVYQSIGNKNGQGQIMMSLGLANINLRDFAAAESNADQLLRLGEETKDPELQSGGSMLKSLVYLVRSQFVQALEAANRSSALLTAVTAGDMRAAILANVGAVYSALGSSERALQTYEQALALLPKAKKNAQLSSLLMLAGNSYIKVGQYAKALEMLKLAQEYTHESGDKAIEAAALTSLGVLMDEQDNYAESIKYYEQALVLARAQNARGIEGSLLANLGYVYTEADAKDPRALAYLTEALSFTRMSDDKFMEANSLAGLSLYWSKNKNPELAVFYGKQYVNIAQSLRSGIRSLDSETQKTFAKRFENQYRRLAEILIGLGRISEAEKVVAMLKEEEYFDFLRRDSSAASGDTVSLTPEEQQALEKYREYADQLTKLGAEYSRLQSESLTYDVGKFPKQARLDEIEKMIANANQVFNGFLDKLKSVFGQKDVRVASVESGTQAILKELNDSTTVFISTISGEDKLNIILTTSAVQKAYTVEMASADLNKLVADFREALRNPKIDPRRLGKSLYDRLFPAGLQKDLSDINTKTILWSLDGTLRYIPVAALWDGKNYLVERYNNVVVTLASRDKLTKQPTERTAWKVLGVGVSKGGTVTGSDGSAQTFSPLSAVPEELCRVVSDPDAKEDCARIVGDKSGVIAGKELLDEKFTLPAFNAYLGRFPIIHISSHFNLNPGNENDSFLLLGGGDERKLSLATLRQGSSKFLGVELLTLSACNTAMASGNRSNGVEVEGFGALAQNQGARSVLASLWSVADSSTRDLMVEFYRQLESNPSLSKADALRAAQMALLYGTYKVDESPEWKRGAGFAGSGAAGPPFTKDPKAPFAHPYYWSPFVMMGNWK